MDTRLTCGPFAFDPRTQTVWNDGVPLRPIGSRAALLLGALLSRPGEVLTKAELMDAVWGGTAVEEGNLTVQIANLRKALGTAPDGAEWIATVHRVGYRFHQPGGRPPGEPEAAAIAVLPFAIVGGDASSAQFADGLAEDIITALSKLAGLTVIARNSSFVYRGSDIDLRKVGEELDITHLMTGSLRGAGARARIGVQLVDCSSGAQLWADTYDRDLSGGFAVSDEVAARVIDAVRTRLALAPALPPQAGTTRVSAALALYREGRAILEEPYQNADRTAAARALLDRALEQDPAYADANAMLTLAYITECSNGWIRDPAKSLDLARASADAAIAAESHNALAHAVRALVAAFDHDPKRQGEESARALELDPNSAEACLQRANFLTSNGDPERAIPLAERALRLNPVMTPVYMHHLANTHMVLERYETAAALFRARITLVPETDMSRALLCIALGHLGKTEEARRVWAELKAINPGYSLEQRIRMTWSGDPAQAERQREGLRKAGLPAA